MLIGLIAPAGAGKDTAADILVNQYGFVKISFSDLIYREVSERYGVPEWILKDRKFKESSMDELGGMSPREALQKHGDEKRAKDPDYFLRNVEKFIEKGGDVVVSDVRFIREAEFLKRLGGKLIRIVTKGFSSILQESAARHCSELEMATYPCDAEILNVYGYKYIMARQVAIYICLHEREDEKKLNIANAVLAGFLSA